jgi:hypothetical protein
MTEHRQVDEPSPTIVGPRPAEGAGGKLSIPQGMERLLTLAGISADWREKVLADPLAAAAEAKIELSASERAILGSVPRAVLEGMAASFARKHGGLGLGKLAAGAAAAALLAGTAYAAAPAAGGGVRADEPSASTREGMPAPTGIRPDVPEEAPAVLWMTSLDDALAQAKKDNRAVMAVFLPPTFMGVPAKPPPPTRGISSDEPKVSVAEKSYKVVQTDSKEFRSAVKNANLLAVRVAPPVGNPVDPDMKARKAYDEALAAYQATLKKYALAEDKLPAVVFLAPDGSELAKLVQPDDESVFVKTIGEVPPKLAKWITDQRVREPGQEATDGIRPDLPATKGIRPDIPEGKL